MKWSDWRMVLGAGSLATVLAVLAGVGGAWASSVLPLKWLRHQLPCEIDADEYYFPAELEPHMDVFLPAARQLVAESHGQPFTPYQCLRVKGGGLMEASEGGLAFYVTCYSGATKSERFTFNPEQVRAIEAALSQGGYGPDCRKGEGAY